MSGVVLVVSLFLFMWGIARRDANDPDGVDDGAFSAKRVEAALEEWQLSMEIQADKASEPTHD